MGLDLPSDRRVSGADLLAKALLHASEPMTFDELATKAGPAPVRDIAAWLGNAVENGLIEEVGADRLSPRRFRLRPRGTDVLTSARRGNDGVVAA